MLIDTHVHFDGLIEESDADTVIQYALARGVGRIIAVGGSEKANDIAAEIAGTNPEHVRCALGYDRYQISEEPDEDTLESLLKGEMVTAVGETGLDYHYGNNTREEQISLFRHMLDLAARHLLPVIVHSREAEKDTLELLKNHSSLWRGKPDGIGVLHCFTGTAEFACRLLELGFSISFSGIVTFKNSGDLRGIAAEIPEDRLLIETDSPYLAPEPLRGHRNEPANVYLVAEALAAIRNSTFEKIARITTQNAERIFDYEKKKT